MRRRARTDLCGGRSAMAVPTATGEPRHPRLKSAVYSSRRSLAANLPLFPGRIQLPVALRVDFLLAPRSVHGRPMAARSPCPSSTACPSASIRVRLG
jgi:hypothetical protein